MKRKSTSAEPEKVHRLTLAELAAHDDACSDTMVDNAYFKSQIRKNKTKYFPLRIKEDEVPQILLHKVIVAKDSLAAEKELLRMPGLKRYRAGLKSKAEQENFLKHLRKYIYMYQTDCPWEVSTTNRYTITTYEAAVTARQRVKQGQIIKYLVGTLVPLTVEESADLDHTNRNFSIVVSSRKKNSSIFLGPARFANHDCDANGRLVTRGNDAMEVIAMKNIEVGDEITVSYGDDYFGPGNVDCLCHTCERLVRNGWAGAHELSDSPRNSALPSQEPGSPILNSPKRKRESSSNSQDPALLRPSKRLRAKPSPSKLQHSWTPTSTDSEVVEATHEIATTKEILESEADSVLRSKLAPSPPASPAEDLDRSTGQTDAAQPVEADQQHPMITRRRSSGYIKTTKELNVNKLAARILGTNPNAKQYPLSPASTVTSTTEPGSSFEGGEPNSLADKVTIKVESVETSQVESDTIVVMNESDHNQENSDSTNVNNENRSQPTAISTLTTTEVSKTIPLSMTDASAIVPSIEPPIVTSTSTTTTAQISIKPLSDRIRVPGDYSLTRKLLAQPHDRWVQCHNDRCQGFFVQPNGYQTRRECPRCERHSMLYGFSWPKTDPDPRKILERSPGGKKSRAKSERSAYRRAGKCGKGIWYEGGGDEEERVMDHRTVHRFVLPEDEKSTTKRGLLKQAEEARSSRQEFDPFELTVASRKRTESIGLTEGFDTVGERGSMTPDGAMRRRSNRFVTRIGVYADV